MVKGTFIGIDDEVQVLLGIAFFMVGLVDLEDEGLEEGFPDTQAIVVMRGLDLTLDVVEVLVLLRCVLDLALVQEQIELRYRHLFA
jgi:hypothetical protein